MAKKWINSDRFRKTQREAEKEESSNGNGYASRRDVLQYGMKDRKTEEATITLRILPTTKDDIPEEFSRTMYFHLINTGDGWKYVTCLTTYKEKCPICEVSKKLFMGAAEDKKIAKNLYRQEKKVCHVYVIQDPRDANRAADDDKTSGRIMRLEYKKQISDIIKVAGSDDEEKGIQDGIIDPSSEGYNFLLVVKEKITKDQQTGQEQRYPTYAESCFSRKSSPLAKSDKAIEEILENVPSLDEYKQKERTEPDVMFTILDSMGLLDLVQPEEGKTEPKATKRREEPKEEVSTTPEETTEPEETNTEGDGLEKEDLDFLNDLEINNDDVPF